MPTRKSQIDRELERHLANAVREVLTHPERVESVYESALRAGYSRAHWSRLFQRFIGEPPGSFARRIQLERACSRLIQSDEDIHKIAESCGYQNASAFTRAFRVRFGQSPRAYRRAKPESASPWHGIHWVSLWDELSSAEVARMNRRFPLLLRQRPPTELAVRERFGSYGRIGEFLGDLADEIGRAEFETPDRPFFTIYYDNVWTHPTSDGMRSHIGYRLATGESLPAGWQRVTLPGGTYATFESAVDRRDRNDAWAWMTRHEFRGIAFDEYEGNPLPWEESKTRLWVRIK